MLEEGKNMRKKTVAQVNCDELTSTLIPYLPVLLEGRR